MPTNLGPYQILLLESLPLSLRALELCLQLVLIAGLNQL